MNLWKSDLGVLQQRLPCTLARIIRPRVIFLPNWWPVRYNAWAYFHFICIAPGLRDAPDYARHYLLGHEYGHIYNNHTLLHFIYWLALFALCVEMVMPMPTLRAAALLILTAVTALTCIPSLAKKRELEADAVAVCLCGQQTALDGSLWMAKKAGTMNNSFRRRRLQRLGWQE